MIFQRKIHQIQSPTLRSVVGGVEGARGRQRYQMEHERLTHPSPLSSLVKKESKILIFEKSIWKNPKHQNQKHKEKIVENLGRARGQMKNPLNKARCLSRGEAS